MGLAIAEAGKARDAGEVPIGAVLVDRDERIVALGHNQTIGRCDASAHAEMLVIRKAAWILKNYRLSSTTLYVTIEPCIMCMGAIIHARIARLVFGAHDPKWGAAGSLYDMAHDPRLNHQPELTSGVCMAECRDIIQVFFRDKRV
ncbi:MAG: tRNA adenosine(34) deaminase TadA [Desulfatitalea sp.]|nr:tRNA adenosine(34) deaminase TadA [Desulfatitalea sp.]